MTKPPKYKITIEDAYSDGEDLGISAIAFTASPAIKCKGMSFSEQEPKKQFYTDDVKMRICAPAMIPMSIYRNDEDGEYYVEFTADEIEAITSKFMQNLTNKSKFNLEHNDKTVVPAYILETWIVDNPKLDKAFSTFGLDVPKGTLMITTQLTDKTYFDNLVKNGQVGYSIEGFLGLKLSELINKNKLNTMKNQILSKHSKKNLAMTIVNEIEIYSIDVDNTTFNIGDIVTAINSTGVKMPLDDGQYILVDGSSIFLNNDGKIVYVEPKEAAPVEDETAEPVATEVPAVPATKAVKAAAAKVTKTKGKVLPTASAPETTPNAAPETPENEVEPLTPLGSATPAAPEVATLAAEVPATPEAPVTPEVKAPALDEAGVLAICQKMCQPMFDEIYQMIANLKAAIQEEDIANAVPEVIDNTKPMGTKMSIHDRFSAVISIIKE